MAGAEFVFSGALSPVSPNMYPMLALLLLAGGLTATSLFFVDEATRIYKRRSLAEEAALAGAASVLLGLGSFFLLLWTGVYVG